MLEVERHLAGTQKPIAAVCHGVQVLTAAAVIKGKPCTGYPAVETTGGLWVGCSNR